MDLNDRVGIAKQFGAMMHADKGQSYGKDAQGHLRPYSVHLEAVEEVLIRFGETGKAILAAAHLHDVVEDAEVPLSVITSLFGEKVAGLVWAVTDEPGPNRATRKASTYQKIKVLPDALRLKLADRIANVENCIATDEKRLLQMYRNEQPGFEQSLREIGELDDMWRHLEQILRKPKA